MMLDFEAATWAALKEVYPTVKLLGWAYHWKQAVWRKIQEVGLQRSYGARGDVYRLLSKVMALPYLPHEHIPAVFDYLSGKAGPSRELAEVRFTSIHAIYRYQSVYVRELWNTYEDKSYSITCTSVILGSGGGGGTWWKGGYGDVRPR